MCWQSKHTRAKIVVQEQQNVQARMQANQPINAIWTMQNESEVSMAIVRTAGK